MKNPNEDNATILAMMVREEISMVINLNNAFADSDLCYAPGTASEKTWDLIREGYREHRDTGYRVAMNVSKWLYRATQAMVPSPLPMTAMGETMTRFRCGELLHRAVAIEQAYPPSESAVVAAVLESIADRPLIEDGTLAIAWAEYPKDRFYLEEGASGLPGGKRLARIETEEDWRWMAECMERLAEKSASVMPDDTTANDRRSQIAPER